MAKVVGEMDSFTNHFCHDHQPKMSIIPRKQATIHMVQEAGLVTIPSFKKIAVSCNDGIQYGDFEDDFETIVTKNRTFM